MTRALKQLFTIVIKHNEKGETKIVFETRLNYKTSMGFTSHARFLVKAN